MEVANGTESVCLPVLPLMFVRPRVKVKVEVHITYT